MLIITGHLSPTETDGDMLGYDLYSSALADILSEPTMQPPICVGLYAQWGSGKSFLLKKLEGKGHVGTKPVYITSFSLVFFLKWRKRVLYDMGVCDAIYQIEINYSLLVDHMVL